MIDPMAELLGLKLEKVRYDFERETILRRLDGRHVVFGKVISGMDVVYKVEAEGTQSGTPKTKVVIADSGELPL
uniref:PPIase cyclophilin-type domain-containing protein n=1 Tax=Cannabis sativa TaxID=3483 RepID=A0A803QL19_CANSA